MTNSAGQTAAPLAKQGALAATGEVGGAVLGDEGLLISLVRTRSRLLPHVTEQGARFSAIFCVFCISAGRYRRSGIFPVQGQHFRDELRRFVQLRREQIGQAHLG